MVTSTDITARNSTAAATKPKPKVLKKRSIHLGPNCRDLLDEIKTLTYLIEDKEAVIKDLHTNLEQVKKFIISVIHEQNSIGNGALVQSDTDNDSDHQIVIAKNNEHDKSIKKQSELIENKPDIVENRVCVEQPSIIDDGNESEVQLFIEHPSLSTQNIGNDETEVMEVITVNDASSIDSPEHVITIDNHIATVADNHNSEADTAEVITQHNLNPQEFQVLTNMIHVLLEENKTTNLQEESS